MYISRGRKRKISGKKKRKENNKWTDGEKVKAKWTEGEKYSKWKEEEKRE